jgi:hypothetical protein
MRKKTKNRLRALNGDTLEIECILIGNILPVMTIRYRGREMCANFCRSLWGDEEAMTELAIEIIEHCHKYQPFN